jgi:hypothetical protein
MATQKELEERIAQLEAQLKEKHGISPEPPAPAAKDAPADQDDMLLEEVYIPIHEHEVEPPDLAPVQDAPEPPDVAPVHDQPAPGPELAPVHIGSKRALRVMKPPAKKQPAKVHAAKG